MVTSSNKNPTESSTLIFFSKFSHFSVHKKIIQLQTQKNPAALIWIIEKQISISHQELSFQESNA